MAGMPFAFGAAVFGLQTSAALQSGESVLILPGAGLAGNAAIQVTKELGGTRFIAVNTAAEVEAVADLHGLPQEQVVLLPTLQQIRSASGSFFQFDVIFSSGWVSPSISREIWRHIAPFGRFLDCGRKNVLARTVLDTIPLNRGASYLAFDMLDLYSQRPRVLSDLMDTVHGMYRNGQISPLQPLMKKNIAEINDSIAAFSDSYTAGKTLLMHDASSKIGSTSPLLMLPSVPILKLRSDATYLLIGCHGGLGRSLTQWMMAKGARNFTFLSRSGSDSKEAGALVTSLRKAGANVQILRGDVSVREDVERAVSQVDPVHPIRGVIHAAMVLWVSTQLDTGPCFSSN